MSSIALQTSRNNVCRIHCGACQSGGRSRGSVLPVALLLAAVVFTAIPIVAFEHPAQIAVNGKSYRWPKSPVVVILIDGGDPAYVLDGVARNLLPNFRR